MIKEAYPQQFSFERFNSLSSNTKRCQYAKQFLKQIGDGSARRAYQVDEEKVLKVAKSKTGVAQNLQEIKTLKDNTYPCFAYIYKYDEGGTWLEMELAEKLKQNNDPFLKKMTGWADCFTLMHFLKDMLKYCNALKKGKTPKIESEYRPCELYFLLKALMGDKFKVVNFQRYFFEEKLKRPTFTMEQLRFYNKFFIYFLKSDLEENDIDDWMTEENWGIVTRKGKKKLVIIDNGFSQEVFNKYYTS